MNKDKKLRKGDIIRAVDPTNSRYRYRYTNKEVLCEIIHINEGKTDGVCDMIVKIIAAKNETVSGKNIIGKEFGVLSYDFGKATINDLMEFNDKKWLK